MSGIVSFSSAAEFARAIGSGPHPDIEAEQLARARQGRLTKPPGALGRLEELAVFVAGWQGRERPQIDTVRTIVFAGNHGVVRQGVSPYPGEVTAQMVANFEAGGAAINAIARTLGQAMSVVALDLERPTADMTEAPAMSEMECLDALNHGAAAVAGPADLLVFGEMGIGNTTVAAALAAAVFGGSGIDWAGPGTGLDTIGVARKAGVIDRALALHRTAAAGSAFETLRRLGGRELAAIAGAIVAARHARVPVLLDGFIATAAAAVLTLADPHALAHTIAGHTSAEPGHRRLLTKLGMRPLLDLGLRLGEGTGAAMAAMIVQCAVATHSQMATFGEAGVSDREDG